MDMVHNLVVRLNMGETHRVVLVSDWPSSSSKDELITKMAPKTI